MGRAEIIADGVYLIGGPNISRSEDATVFILDCGAELVMIDAGAGSSSSVLVDNIEGLGLDPGRISTLILTHCHIDHIGSAPWFRNQFGCKLVMHDLDADALEQGDTYLTAANWYKTTFPPTPVDIRLLSEHQVLRCGTQELHCLHTPGHTPGSMVVWYDRGGTRILFGQDIHGPFMDVFRSSIADWRQSMQKLIALRADILCEGHYGIFQPADRVESYIRSFLGKDDSCL
jgi:glyoxylase-like metal-dependent hydrolase (beta-lactamase superfamily II)